MLVLCLQVMFVRGLYRRRRVVVAVSFLNLDGRIREERPPIKLCLKSIC